MPAIFVGRFQPFHNGHLEVIKWILKKEKKILIVIGSIQEFQTKENPFSFKERKEMIKNSVLETGIKNFKIYGMPDLFDDILWSSKILEIVAVKTKNEITVFTKNSWTERCFKKIGAEVKPYPIFLNNISGTKIREKIFNSEEWKNLVPKEVLKIFKKIKGVEKIKLFNFFPEKKITEFIKEKAKEAKAAGGVVGISGGIDSSAVAFLAKKALEKKAVFLWLPFIKDCYFQKHIFLLKKKLKIKIKEIYLGDVYKKILKTLPRGDKVSEGNLKPRIRMAALYYFANLRNLLVIGTTNRSEMEIGYFTKYGDGGVDIEPIGDLYKTEIIEMAKRLKLPEEIIKVAPTAGLWADQTDEKEIGLNYQKLDTVLKLLEQGFEEKEISFLTNIPQKKIKNIIKRKEKNAHKLAIPPVCRFKLF